MYVLASTQLGVRAVAGVAQLQIKVEKDRWDFHQMTTLR